MTLRSLLRPLLALCLTLLVSSAWAAEPGVLVLREVGSLSRDARASMAALFRVELEGYGVDLVATPEARDLPAALALVPAAKRAFTLDVIRLDTKMILKLNEVDPAAGGTPLFGESITATGLDELDLVVPRLVKAVMLRKKLEDTQTVENLTAQEGRAWKKKHGEFYWGFGIPFGWTFDPLSSLGYGLNFKAFYEMEHLRVDFYLGGAGNAHADTEVGIFVTDLSVNYLFLTSDWSPYVGGGVGFGMIGVYESGEGFGGVESGPVATLSAGVELFRLHSMRLLVGLRTVLPFFEVSGGRDISALMVTRDESHYIPGFLTEVTLVW